MFPDYVVIPVNDPFKYFLFKDDLKAKVKKDKSLRVGRFVSLIGGGDHSYRTYKYVGVSDNGNYLLEVINVYVTLDSITIEKGAVSEMCPLFALTHSFEKPNGYSKEEMLNKIVSCIASSRTAWLKSIYTFI